MRPELSIVTPTFNRHERLGRVLLALEQQTIARERFEVVVVDDGSTDGTAEWLAGRAYTFPLRLLRQQNSGPAKARNAGVQAATSDLILFLDDDVVPVPELVAEHLSSHADPQTPAVVMGPLASLPHYAQPWVAWEQAQVEKQYVAMQRGDYEPSFRQFWTGNASVARQHLLAAGLFNAEHKRGEDIELGFRLFERGLKFRFNPRARGLHHAERSLDSWQHAHESYGTLEVELFGKLGEDSLLKMLAENFARLNPASQWLLRRTLGHGLRERALQKALRAYLESSAAVRSGKISNRACSLLANLLYWRASAEALGAPRFAEVMRRVDVIRSS
ncbi:MAG TPA: glycosyltransferase family A protein [Polyangiaceae bacterium]|nr:glycosyltransferase family A protein [Polyangiaceae bacterium]